MNSFENLGGDPSKLRARQGSKNLAWQCLKDGKGVDQVALGWSFRHLQRKSWTKTKTTRKKNERAKKERRTRGREYKMRVFGERDTGGVARGEGICGKGWENRGVWDDVEEGKGKAQATRNTKQRPKNYRVRGGKSGRGTRRWRGCTEPRAPSQRPDLLLSIQTACDLPPWIICKYIYFDFVHNMILFRRLASCIFFSSVKSTLGKKKDKKTAVDFVFI